MRRPIRHTTAARRAFTIVELLVAMALIVGTMAILCTAFVTGLGVFSQLKSIGDLQEQLRTAGTLLRRDLAADHLDHEVDGPRRLSDPMPNGGGAWSGGGRRGYFAVRQWTPPTQNIGAALALLPPNGPGYPYNATATNAPYWYEGQDTDQVESLRATDHELRMTVKASGRTAQEGFTAVVPFSMSSSPLLSRTDFDPSGTLYFSQWAEVTYFLRQQGSVSTTNKDGTLTSLPVYTLYRRQRALTPVPIDLNNADSTAPTPVTNGNLLREKYPDLSIRTVPAPTGSVPMPINQVSSISNTPESITNPLNRQEAFVDWRNYTNGQPIPQMRLLPVGLAEVGPTAPAPVSDGTIVNTARYGSDVVLNNVLSFHVRIMTDLSRELFIDPPQTSAGPPVWPRVYDSATSGYRIKAIKITLRIYDMKLEQTRQITIIQDL